MGPGGLATPNRAGVCGRPPTNRPLLAVRETVGCIIVLVLGVGRCAFRPPRVVFVLGLVSLINSLTSGKNGLLGLWVCGNPHVRYPYTLCLGRLGGQASTLVVS